MLDSFCSINQIRYNISGSSVLHEDIMDKNESFNDLILKVLTDCINQQSESELNDQINELTTQDALHDYFKMLAISDTTTITATALFDEVYTENSILSRDGRISLAYENLRNIPQKIAENFSNETKFLDLSFNNFKDLSFLSFFKGLNTLILDKNSEPDETTLPYLPNLQILWLNNCNIVNIPKWLYKIQIQCPNIKQLSLIGNPGARTLLTGANNIEETEYRTFVTETLKSLIYLDGIPTTPSSSTKSSTIITPLSSSSLLGTNIPLIKHHNTLSPTLRTFNKHNEISLPSLLPRSGSNRKIKSNQYNNNKSLVFTNNSINSTIISHNQSKLSSSTSVKSYYLHNSQQQYKQHYNQRKFLTNNVKDNNHLKKDPAVVPLTDNNISNNRKKKNLTSNFKDLFRFNSQRRKSCESSSTN